NGHRVRAQDTCTRYDSLMRVCRERTAPFDLDGLRGLVESSAVPPAGQPIRGAGVATLHQVVAFTGERRLWVRFPETLEKNIRAARGVEFRAAELPSGVPRATARSYCLPRELRAEPPRAVAVRSASAGRPPHHAQHLHVGVAPGVLAEEPRRQAGRADEG